MKEQADLFELRVFDGKEYRTVVEGCRAAVGVAFDNSRGLGKPRQIVRKDKARPARPRYRVPLGMRGSGRTAQDLIGAYMQWAESKALPAVHVYEHTGYPATGHNGMRFIQVPVADFLGPAPAAESDDG